MSSQLLSEYAAVVGVVDPDATAASTVTSSWIPAKNYDRYLAIVMAGTLGSSATVDAKLEQATDSSGTGAKDVTGKAITQLTDAGSDSDKQALINLDVEELDVENDFDHFRLSVTVATATSDIGAVVLGSCPRIAPASDNDLSSIDEIVS